MATRVPLPTSVSEVLLNATDRFVGVGATKRLSAVRWGVAGRIVWAWILTIPAAAAVAAVCWVLLRLIHPL